MKVRKIDYKGCLMIPKAYRLDGLQEESYVVVEQVEEGILIRPLIEEGGLYENKHTVMRNAKKKKK